MTIHCNRKEIMSNNEFIKSWKLIKTESGPNLTLFQVRFDWLENPRNGHTVKATVVEAPDWVNVVALILQAFVATRLLKYGGFGVILLTMPVVALVSYTAMAFVPVLAIVKAMKIAENSTDYSINNTARNVLWLPVSSEMKYKGKPTIDSLFVRLGDGIAALTVLVGVQFLALSTQSFFVLNVALVVIWIILAFLVIREHRRLSDQSE